MMPERSALAVVSFFISQELTLLRGMKTTLIAAEITKCSNRSFFIHSFEFTSNQIHSQSSVLLMFVLGYVKLWKSRELTQLIFRRKLTSPKHTADQQNLRRQSNLISAFSAPPVHSAINRRVICPDEL